jgi:hypothetical protein
MMRKNNSERTTLFIKFGFLYPRIAKIAEQFHLPASGVVRMLVSIALPAYETTPLGDRAAAARLYAES